MTLDKLAKQIRGAKLLGDGAIEICGLDYDSRQIKKNMLFMAIKGYKLDGNKYIPNAIDNGAVAVMSEDPPTLGIPVIKVDNIRLAMADASAAFYGYPGKRLFCFAVTGTNGKSTSVYLIRKMLEASGIKAGMMNSLVYDTGTEKFKAERTTPESAMVQKYLYGMQKAGCTHAVIEVSSHALVLYRVENIDFKVGLYTNFSRDHLDFHHTMEEYLEAKKLLLKKLEENNQTIVLNLDIPEYAGLAREAKCKCVTYSAEGKKADVMITDAKMYPDRSEFALTIKGNDYPAVYRLPGRYNLANACGASAAAYSGGVSIEHIIAGLESAEPVSGRFVPVLYGQPFSVIIDYAHTSDALIRLCQSAREFTKGRLMVLFGCGGDRDRGKRPLMGAAATENADFALLTSDNPRTEDPRKIIEDVLPGIKKDNYEVVIDRSRAIETIISKAGPNDTILIAGKGAEEYQEIGTTKYPYSDHTEIIKALEKLGYKG